MRKIIVGTIFVAVARAQIHRLSSFEVPANRTLRTLHAFFVYAFDEAPERPFGRPFVEFQSLVGKSKPGSERAQGDDSVQLSLIRVEDLERIREGIQFCCSAADRQAGRCSSVDQLWLSGTADSKPEDKLAASVSFAGSKDNTVKRFLRTSGIYILAISNCGSATGGSTDGVITVKHAYGFLPGNEYHKMPFYGWLSLFSTGLAIVWFVVLLQFRSEISKIQKMISAFVILCVAEALFWQYHYQKWNSAGSRSHVVLLTASLLSSLKWASAFVFALVVSLGWSVTRPYLDRQLMLKIQAMWFFYVVFGFIQTLEPAYRTDFSFSSIITTIFLSPAVALPAGICYWMFKSLSVLLGTLEERQQQEKLVLFQRFWGLMIASIATSFIFVLCQCIELMTRQPGHQTWKYEWLLSDATSNAAFLLGLGVVMRLWAPGKGSQDLVYHRASQNTDAKQVGASTVDDVFDESLDDALPR